MSNQLLTAEDKHPEKFYNPRLICEVKDVLIELTEEQNSQVNAKIQTFVAALNNSGQSHKYYEENRNTLALKAAEDNFIGKKAEVFVRWHLINERKFPHISIDFEIRSGCSKGWTIDLPFAKKDERFPNIHVKSCQGWILQYAKDFSWTFQLSNNSGRGGRDSIFDGPDDDLVAFVFLENHLSSTATIKAILPWGIIKNHLKDPVKESLVGLKKCIYLKDLQQALIF